MPAISTASTYMNATQQLAGTPRRWLITGVAGFIGSNLLEALLKLGQHVVGLDNFSTGHTRNLNEVKSLVTPAQWQQFTMIEGDIRNADLCQHACAHVDYVLHHAALGSVPLSIADPLQANAVNVDGFLHILVASRDARVKRVIYAASSATYGDHPAVPIAEHQLGRQLSPYAVSKYVNELYADVFFRNYGLETIGLRYFNIFGQRQDPHGAYAAVIPKWISQLIADENVTINGDGSTSRDFCYIQNVIQANILAALVTAPEAVNQVYNIAVGDQTSLNELYHLLKNSLITRYPNLGQATPEYRDFRPGDVLHSLADISKAKHLLGYQPTHRIGSGLEESIDWYISHRD